MNRIPLLALVIILISACTTQVKKHDVPVIEGVPEQETGVSMPKTERQPAQPPPSAAPVQRSSNRAVLTLIESAQEHRQNQRYGAAAQSLERAIRIEPRNSELYLGLARVRLEQGNRSQAIQLCKKAVVLAGEAQKMTLACDKLLAG